MTTLLTMFLLACSGGATASTEPADLAALANQIEAAPDDADALLEAAGHTRESFDDALYDVAMDPDATAAYLGAR